MGVKPFKDVQIGDKAYDVDLGEYQGKILCKGSYSYLIALGYESTTDEEEVEDLMGVEFRTANFVAISQDPSETLEGYENLVCLYNDDPSSVFCKK